MDQEQWLTTREVLARTNIHRRTLDTWLRRGHLPAPERRDNVLYWHPSTIMVCLARVKKNQTPVGRSKEALAAQQNTEQAIRWLVARYIVSVGGSLPLAGIVISISKQRLEQIQDRYTILYSEEAGQLVLRIANNPQWTEPTPPSPKQ